MGGTMAESIRYSLHDSISIPELQKEVDQLWVQLKTDSRLQEDAKKAGLDVSKLQPLDLKSAITLKQEGAGIEPATIAVVVAFAPVAGKVLSDLWTNVFLPRIKRKFGED